MRSRSVPTLTHYPKDMSRWVDERLTYDEMSMLSQAVNMSGVESPPNITWVSPDNLTRVQGNFLARGVMWLFTESPRMSEHGVLVLDGIISKWEESMWWWCELGDFETMGVERLDDTV